MLRRMIKHWTLFPHVLLVMLVVWACGYLMNMGPVHAGAVIGGGLVYLYMVEAEQHVRIRAMMRRRAEEEVWQAASCCMQSAHRDYNTAGGGEDREYAASAYNSAHDCKSCSHKFDHQQQSKSRKDPGNSIDHDVGHSQDHDREELAGAAWLNALLRSSWPALEAGYLCKVAHARLSEYLADTSSSSSPSSSARAKRRPMVLERIRFGSSPPLVRSCKLLQHPKGPSTAALELDFSFIAGDDMGIELLVPMSSYFTTKLFCDNLRIEGKINLGFKFVPYYPYISQLSMAFTKVPSLGLSVRPLSSNILAITDLPLIASWVSNAIHTAIQTCGIVEPNEWSFDFVQLWGTDYGLSPTYTSGTQSRRCYIILEILEGRNLMAKDSTGFSDPYVIITYQKCRFKTKTRKQTLNPSWQECFRIDLEDPSIVRSSGEHSKVLLRCRDRDLIVDDELVRGIL